MTETIVNFFQQVTKNDYLTLFLISIIPIIELRGALILASTMNVNPYLAFLVCFLGSSSVIIPVLLLLRPFINWLKKTKLFKRLAQVAEEIIDEKTKRVIESGEKVKTKNVDLKKFLGLLIFVGIPLPFTGAWTGSAIGAFLKMKIGKAAGAIALGNLVAALLLSLLILLVPVKYIDIILYAFLILVLFAVAFLLFSIISRYSRSSKEKLDKSNEDDVVVDENCQSITSTKNNSDK